MGTLYEINEQIENFEYQFDEETGEMLNAMELDTLEMERDAKIEGIACFIKNLDAEAEEIQKEINALKDRMAKKNKKADGLEDYLKYCLGGQTFESPKVAITYRKSTKVNVTGLMPEEYYRTKTVTEPDKKKIKDDINAGKEVPGAELIECKNMQIK